MVCHHSPGAPQTPGPFFGVQIKLFESPVALQLWQLCLPTPLHNEQRDSGSEVAKHPPVCDGG